MNIVFLNLDFKNVRMLGSRLPSFSLEGIFITEKKILKIEYFKWKFSHAQCEPQMLPAFENEGDFSLFWCTAITLCGYRAEHCLASLLAVLHYLHTLRFSSVRLCFVRDIRFSNFKVYLCSIKYSFSFKCLSGLYIFN